MLRRLEDCKIIRDYKGFRSRQSPDSDNYQNVFYVREDGREVCLGQTTDIVVLAEFKIRYPLPTWMTGKPEAFSPHHDPELVRNTCTHGVSMEAYCGTCHESYGNARTR